MVSDLAMMIKDLVAQIYAGKLCVWLVICKEGSWHDIHKFLDR